MDPIHRSLWLPIGPPNFFSPMSDAELIHGERARAAADDTGGSVRIPHLRESVLRRLIEVLPASFGYQPDGRCEFDPEQDNGARPTSLTMTLRPADADVRLETARPANRMLVESGVDELTVRVSELGFYTFTAIPVPDPRRFDRALVDAALVEHIVHVFGGAFAIDRLTPSPDRHRIEGRSAVRAYNGLTARAPAPGVEEVPLGPPAGALSFYQLNIMMEGLCNQSLLPAVFFEHYDEARRWLDQHRRKSSVVTRLDDFIREVTVRADAASHIGQIVTLRRFLTMSRGSLQWMRRSVESVRRSLLDQMMAVSHRQARLIQLDLAGMEYERTPEMTGDATESQLRGYVMLIATKLPLIASIGDGAVAAARAVSQDVERVQPHLDAPHLEASDLDTPHLDAPDDLTTRADQLVATVDSWTELLHRLRSNVMSLETAVEHDWQERLLYEQEQARSEQEAMAEIERSRRGRPESRRLGGAAYNTIGLMVNVATLVAAILTTNTPPAPDRPIWLRVLDLWPILALSGLFFILLPAIVWARAMFAQREPNSDLYNFEFAFRLDERADQHRVRQYLSQDRTVHIRSSVFGRIKLRRLGGWRWERISTDTTLLKVHSVAVVRVKAFQYARFEIVTEIMMRKISDTNQFFLRQCRMFGDSPVALPTDRIGIVVKELLEHSCKPLSDDLDLAALTDPIDLLRGGPVDVAIPPQRTGDDRAAARV